MKKDPMPGGLVFLESIGVKIDAFTTSSTIASGTGINHRRVREAIHRHQKAFESFGVLVAYQTETAANKTGGRKATGYLLNEQQAAFLLTLLKNTPAVVEFKRRLVLEFFNARQELARRDAQRTVKLPVRRSLTDSIRDSGENKRFRGHAFAAYTNLIYKAVTGRTAAQMRKDAGLPKGADVVSLLTADELARVTKREAQVATLLDCGMRYDAIKTVLEGGKTHDRSRKS